jgi:predicted DCC family thiol-disulfide oxidoreductase YuxK
MQTRMTELPPHVLFYDGVCAMCNGIVKAMLRFDRDRAFYFAPLQGDTAELARALHPDFPSEIETVVYVRRGEVFLRSRAAALAMREMPYPARALSWFRFLPACLTDFFYGIVARVRYRVFGKYAQCPLPPAEHRARFLP